jgi:UrcA family protein
MSLFSKTNLLAGAACLLFAAPALADDYYSDTAYSREPTETVVVTAPAIRAVPGAGLNAPERLRLSQSVSFGDLDLRDPSDARELKERVADAARDVCLQLHEASPAPQLYGTSCYRTALQDAEIKANRAIRNARYDYYDRY